MTTTSAPGQGATDPDRSPSAGIEFRMPTDPAASDDVTQPGGSDNQSSPPSGDASASAEGKPPGGRRRGKSTSDLLSAYEDLRAQGKAIEAEIGQRRATLETECYSVLGSALFAQRKDDQVQAAYQSITAPLGARMKRKLAELEKLLDMIG